MRSMNLTEYTSVILRQHTGRFIIHANKYEIIDSKTREIIGIAKANMFIPFIRKSTKFYTPHSEEPILYLKEQSHLLSREYVLSDQYSQTVGKLTIGMFRIRFILKLLDQITGLEYKINIRDPKGKVLSNDEQHVASIVRTQKWIHKGPRDIEKYKVEIHEEENRLGNLPALLLAGTIIIDHVLAHERVI